MLFRSGGFWLLFLLDRFALPYWVALPLAAVLVGISSLLPEQLVFRRLYGQELPSMIGALGLSVAIAEGASFKGCIDMEGRTEARSEKSKSMPPGSSGPQSAR